MIQDWLNQEVPSSEREEMEKIIAMTEKLDVPAGKSKTQAWDQLLSKLDTEDQSETKKPVIEDELIQGWLETEVTSSEKEEMEKVIAFTEKLNVPSNQSKEQAWDQLLSKIDHEGTSKERILVPQTTSRRTWLGYAASVAAVVLVGLYFLIPNQSVTLSTQMGEQKAFTLPDNSVVTLNANSSITYNKKSWEDARELSLEGEAFFEVEPGSDFEVNTQKGSITVVGTSFNVSVRNETLAVACFEGKVAVTSKTNEQELLEERMQATIDENSDRLDIGSFDPNQTATWRIGEFYFNESNLGSVIEELERQFKIKVNVAVDIKYRTYSGYFNNQSLVEALQLVLTPMGLKYEMDGNQVTVK